MSPLISTGIIVIAEVDDEEELLCRDAHDEVDRKSNKEIIRRNRKQKKNLFTSARSDLKLKQGQ